MNEQYVPDSYDQTQRLFAYGEIKANGKTFAVVTSNEIREKLALTERQTVQLLTRLVKAARIQRLQRKLYLIPGRLPPGKTWKPSAHEVLPCYMNCLQATWQATGIAALAHHGFSTQIVQKIALYNNVLSGERKIAGNTFTFIKLPQEKLGFTSATHMPGAEANFFYSSRARTVFDVISDQKHFSYLPEAYLWLATIAQDKKTLQEFKKCCLALGSQKAIARVGFVLAHLGHKTTDLFENHKKLGTKSLVTLVPGRRRGVINEKWGIIVNTSLEQLFNSVETPDEDDE